MRYLPVLLSSLVVIAGCAAVGNDSDPVEEKWASRDVLPGCGEVRLSQGESLEQASREGVACLRAALDSGEGAELTVTYPTVEGDPITIYRRVTPTGTVEVYTDSTEDNFGQHRWTYKTCENATLPRILDC